MISTKLERRSIQIRERIVRVLDASRRGHPASALSLVEILMVLYDDILNYNPRWPAWPDRDRFILSKGHGCLAQYVLLAEKGFFPENELTKFCKSDGILGGHPDRNIPGIETASGSLGHGLSIGVGMALNARLEQKNYRTFVLLGDGESNEGSVWEAAMCAAKHKLDNLIAIIDYNKMQSYGGTSVVQDLEPLKKKWQSFGFTTIEVDGHDVALLRSTLQMVPFNVGNPSAIICHTVKGRGIAFMENDAQWHHKSRLSDQEITAMNEALGIQI